MGEIRDPIYGFITPNETEFKIINTKIFQRLRRIKQLAMAYLVYPGANHTRFDHSVGVYHLASLMADKLLPSKQNEERRRIVRLAALLHDIGHGPFSHVSEDILNKFSDSTSNTSKEKIHEEITAKLIDNNEELKKFVRDADKLELLFQAKEYSEFINSAMIYVKKLEFESSSAKKIAEVCKKTDHRWWLDFE